MITFIIGFIAGVAVAVALTLLFFQKKKLHTEVEILKEQMKDLSVYLDGLPSVPKEKRKKIVIEGLRAEGEKAVGEYKWAEAIDYFQKALTLATGKDKGVILQRLGWCYYFTGDLSQALRNLQESLEQARLIKDSQGEAANLGNIGTIYQAKGDLDQALKYHQESLKIKKEIGYKQGEANSLNNLAAVYQQKGDLDKTLKCLEQALKIFEEIGMPEEIGIVKENIKRISQQMKQMKAKANDG